MLFYILCAFRIFVPFNLFGHQPAGLIRSCSGYSYFCGRKWNLLFSSTLFPRHLIISKWVFWKFTCIIHIFSQLSHQLIRSLGLDLPHLRIVFPTISLSSFKFRDDSSYTCIQEYLHLRLANEVIPLYSFKHDYSGCHEQTNFKN